MMLSDFDVVTVGYMGWSGVQNGDLVKLVDGRYDILVTGDQNLRYQKNLKKRSISIIELPFTTPVQLTHLIDHIIDAINKSTVGSDKSINMPNSRDSPRTGR